MAVTAAPRLSLWRELDWPRTARAVVVPLALILLPIWLGRAAPGLLSQFRALMIGLGLTYALMALSLNLLMGYAGQVSLGHAGFFGLGAFVSSLVTDGYLFSMGTGMVTAAICGGFLAFLVGLPSLRIKGLYLAISTLAFGVAMQIYVFRLSFLTAGSAGASLPRPRFGSFEVLLNADYLAILMAVLVAVWIFDRNITRSKVGRAFFAIRADEDVAASFGVFVAGYKLLAFTLSGALAALAGSLFGHLVGFVQSESFEFDLSMLFVVMVVVGGLGSRWGVMTAAFFFGILPRVLKALEGWDLIVGAALLIFTISRHPEGMAGAIRHAREKKGRKKAQAGLSRTARAAEASGGEAAAGAAGGGSADDEADDEIVIPRFVQVRGEFGPFPGVPEVHPGDPLLDVRDVAIRFGGLKALDGVSLQVPKRAIVGLIGPNGAGKSTLFNCISGFARPTTGRITYAGVDILNMPPDARSVLGMGRTFQNIGLVPDESVLENFLLAQHTRITYGVLAALAGTPRARLQDLAAARRAREAIEALGLEDIADKRAGELSGGQQRIVEIGCALASAPDMLLLDEPSAGLSPAAAEGLATRLSEIRTGLDKTILLIEHHIPMVLSVCDYVYVLNYGKVLAEGRPQEIIENPEVARAYLGAAA